MSRARSIGLAMGLAIALAGAIAVLWTGAFSGEGSADSPESEAPAAAAVPALPPEPVRAPTVSDHSIESGGTLELEAASLPQGRPLVLALRLGEPSQILGPRPVRVIAPDGRLLHATGRVDPEDRLTASLEIDPAWLIPGRYIVEVKTTERSHFALRRYAIEVR